MANPYKTGHGSTLTLYSSTGSTALTALQSVTPPQVTADRIEVSHLGTTGGFKEYISPDLIDGGTMSVTYEYDGTNPDRATSGACLYLGTTIAKYLSFKATFAGDAPAAYGVNGVANRTLTLNIAGTITPGTSAVQPTA